MSRAHPKSAPTSSQQSRAVSELSGSVSALALVPTQAKKKNRDVQTKEALGKIESSPNGSVYEGKRGRPCKLEANYLRIDSKDLVGKAFHYDVSFDSMVPKKMLPVALATFMKTFFALIQFAFDGRCNFYTYQRLEIDGTVIQEYEKPVTAIMGDRSKDFKVKVQFAAEIDMSVLRNFWQTRFQRDEKPSQAIQCLDVILRTVFKSLTTTGKAVNVGRALYFAPAGRIDYLGEGMELWYGLFQSAVLGRQSLYLNVDVAHKAFPSAIPILDFLKSFDRDGRIPARLNPYQENQLNDYLKMLTISYQSNPREAPKTFGYNGLVIREGKAQGANNAVFVADGTKMTVQQYFKDVKKINLQYPELPVLHVGSRTRNIYLPLEFCRIPAGQATNRKVTPNCVAAMIKYSATSTEVRKKKIRDLLDRIDYSSKNGEVKGFGINVEKNFQKVDGRLIDSPQIKYKNGNDKPIAGVWRGKNFLETQQQPIKWAIINCDDRTTGQSINNLSKIVLNEANRQRMQLTPFNMSTDMVQVNMMRTRQNELEQIFDKLSKAGYGLVIVVITDRNDCYAKIKQAAELRVGILTQCLKANTLNRMEKGNPQMTVSIIKLKTN